MENKKQEVQKHFWNTWKLNALDTLFKHVVHRVAAASAHAMNLDTICPGRDLC